MSLYLETFIKDEAKREAIYAWAHEGAVPEDGRQDAPDEELKQAAVRLHNEFNEVTGKLFYTLGLPREESGKTAAPSIREEYTVFYDSILSDTMSLRRISRISDLGPNIFEAESEDLEIEFDIESEGDKRILIEVANWLMCEDTLENKRLNAHLCVYPLSINKLAEPDLSRFASPVIESNERFYTKFAARVNFVEEQTIKEKGIEQHVCTIALKRGLCNMCLVVDEETIKEKDIKKDDLLMIEGRIVAEIVP